MSKINDNDDDDDGRWVNGRKRCKLQYTVC